MNRHYTDDTQLKEKPKYFTEFKARICHISLYDAVHTVNELNIKRKLL